MKNVTAYGTIKRNGKTVDLKVNGKIAFNGQLIDMVLNGDQECKVVINISRDAEPKRNAQLRYYYAVVVPYCMLGYKSLGWQFDKEKTDNELRNMFYSEEIVNTETGEIKKDRASLAKISKEDLSEYIERVTQFAAEDLGVQIPPPEPQ